MVVMGTGEETSGEHASVSETVASGVYGCIAKAANQ
jgi:hypothetical protein